MTTATGSNITLTVSPPDNTIQEKIKAFDELTKELLANDQLTQSQIQRLEDNFDSFRDCVTAKNADKDTALKIFKRLKNALSETVGIASGIEKFIILGKSIINLLK